MIKRPNLRIHGVEEGAKIQTKCTRNLFNEITPKNFPNLCDKVQGTLELQTDMIRKEQHHDTSYLK
jgi:hypothetical protein